MSPPMYVHRLHSLNPLPFLRSISPRLHERSWLQIAIRWPDILWSWLRRTRRHSHFPSRRPHPTEDLVSAERYRRIKKAGKTSYSRYAWRRSFADWNVLVCVYYISGGALDRAYTGGYSVWMGCGARYLLPKNEIVLTGTVFSSVFSYLVDVYREWSASAMAANTFLRCIMAGGFPLFSVPVSLIREFAF